VSVLAFVLLSILFASRPVTAGEKDLPFKKEYQKLAGTWRALSGVSNGKKMTLPKGKTVILNLKGNQFTIKIGAKVAQFGTFKLDPTTTPKSQDMTPGNGGYKGQTIPAIYELNGDTLRVCLGPPNRGRPKEFSSKKGSRRTLFVYKRVKK
jgi:uncharacterized protein (TIGR03067 family)